MSELATANTITGQGPHAAAALWHRIENLLSPVALRVLELRYEPQHGALIIGCVGIPCWLQPAPDGSETWAFGCPWWRTLLREDSLFESVLLTEVGNVKMHVDGMLEKLDLSKVN
jgi:hypothetical protein